MRQNWLINSAIFGVKETGQLIITRDSCFCEKSQFGNSSAMSADALFGHLEPVDENSRVLSRWGIAASAGYQPLPDVLLFHQDELGLCSEDLNVLLHITAHWYYPDKMPFPRSTTIARRMGVSLRTVQRSMTRLRKNKLIGKAINADGRKAIDLTPLVTRLRPLAERRLLDKGIYPGEARSLM